ncbi:PREDICTED: uncharacterized protein LOC104603529 [Nelumbo nucifera]|uniref:Uncharacterized protein LOC104603529 n=1 Tax=Nelumbo nucifera TaxID=4432 RepID=A0A1U8AST5_NELNU|nr:PREDICTED: uncharacterized protein LOC104603529 [Nelumbo nucifera]
MAKNDDRQTDTWGTWEELLLACAVNRHGTNRWDSVAMEIQTRSSTLHPLTAQNCKQKYHDLKRRFMAKDDKTDDGEDGSEPDDKKGEIPWLEELRKLRVAELRREVQRYDVSIVSLQLKVKRLKEERERSLREKESSVAKSDLEKDSEQDRAKEEKGEVDEQPEKSSPENAAGARVSGEESDRENQSFNESNSTDPKAEIRDNGVGETEKKREPVETVTGGPDPVSGESKPVGEGSYNGSSDTVAKESAAAPPIGKSLGAVKATVDGDSLELWESVAESKGGGEEGMKESSDVQSSASLSSKKNRKKTISGSSSGEEPGTEEISPAIKRISVKSQPLVAILEIIRSHKHGSMFERRLDSQDTARYRNLVRQHLDLETVRSRLEEGRYSGCSRKFFRDLLLLFSNAIVFFPKNSSESSAAIALRDVVRKEMAKRHRKLDQLAEDPPPPPLPVFPVPSKIEPPDSVLLKPKPAAPMIACRKRSSISAKASTTTSVDRKGEQRPVTAAVDEKAVVDRKQADDSSATVADDKKKTRERPTTSGARSSRTGNNKGRTNTTSGKNSNANAGQSTPPSSNPVSTSKGNAAREGSPEPKAERKNNNTAAVAKKRSATNFLNRMKKSSSSNGTLLETLKSSVNNSNNNKGGSGGGATEQKKTSGRSDGRKDQVLRQGSGGKQTAEQSSPAKRSVGRPPKRAMGTPPLPPPAPSKRVRESAETEAAGSRQARKRARR